MILIEREGTSAPRVSNSWDFRADCGVSSTERQTNSIGPSHQNNYCELPFHGLGESGSIPRLIRCRRISHPIPGTDLLDRGAERRQDILSEPRVPFFPESRSPRRMWKHKIIGEIIPEISHPLSDRSRPKHMLLGIAADQQGEAYSGQQFQELSAP